MLTHYLLSTDYVYIMHHASVAWAPTELFVGVVVGGGGGQAPKGGEKMPLTWRKGPLIRKDNLYSISSALEHIK